MKFLLSPIHLLVRFHNTPIGHIVILSRVFDLFMIVYTFRLSILLSLIYYNRLDHRRGHDLSTYKLWEPNLYLFFVRLSGSDPYILISAILLQYLNRTFKSFLFIALDKFEEFIFDFLHIFGSILKRFPKYRIFFATLNRIRREDFSTLHLSVNPFLSSSDKNTVVYSAILLDRCTRIFLLLFFIVFLMPSLFVIDDAVQNPEYSLTFYKSVLIVFDLLFWNVSIFNAIFSSFHQAFFVYLALTMFSLSIKNHCRKLRKAIGVIYQRKGRCRLLRCLTSVPRVYNNSWNAYHNINKNGIERVFKRLFVCSVVHNVIIIVGLIFNQFQPFLKYFFIAVIVSQLFLFNFLIHFLIHSSKSLRSPGLLVFRSLALISLPVTGSVFCLRLVFRVAFFYERIHHKKAFNFSLTPFGIIRRKSVFSFLLFYSGIIMFLISNYNRKHIL